VRNYRFTAFFLSILILLSGLSVFATEPETASDAYSGITVGEATPEATPEPEQIYAAEENEGFYCDKLTSPNSKSIFMVSLDTDTVVYTLNPDEQRPMASLTKIMSYIVIAELVDDLHNTRFTVPEEVQTELQGTNSSLAEIKGILFGVGAAALYASVILMNKKLPNVPAFDKTIVQLGVAAIALLGISDLIRRKKKSRE